MKHTLKSISILLVLVMFFTVVFVGCKGPTPGKITKDADFIYVIPTEPTTLDPHYIPSAIAGQIECLINETLFQRDANSKAVPLLAENAEEAADGHSWIIKLKEGVKFTDGTPFNAEAVKYTFDRLLDPKTASPKASALVGVTGTEVISEYEVKIDLEKRNLILPSILTNYTTAIICPKVAEKYGLEHYGEHPVGTGALKLDHWDRGSEIVLVKNTDYHGTPPTVDKLTIKFAKEEASRIMMIKSGSADVVQAISPTQVADLEADTNVEVVKVPSYRVMYLGVNCSKAPFNDLRVRQAIAYAIDGKSLVDNILCGMAVYPPSGLWAYPEVENSVPGLDPHDVDLEKSKSLLKDAGYPDGFQCKMYCSAGVRPMDTQIVQACQGMLKKVGIKVEIMTMEHPALLQFLAAQNESLDMFFMSKGSSTGDPEYDMLLYIPVKGTMNYAQYNNPEVEQMVHSLGDVKNLEERAALLKVIQTRFNDDCGFIALYGDMQIYAKASNVEGLDVNANELAKMAWLVRK